MKLTRATAFLGLGLACVSARTLTPKDGKDYVEALAVTNRFCPLRCAQEINQPESTAELAEWMSTAGQKYEHLTVKGGGHSYGCQSNPKDGEGMISTKLLNKAEIVVRKDGSAYARLGAGHVFHDIMPALVKMGYIMPHGECITVGLSGWMMNGGTHPETANYMKLYGYTSPFLTKITGVDYDGNIVVIDKDGLNYVQSTMSPAALMLRKAWTESAGVMLKMAMQKMGGLIPAASDVMRLFQQWGASLMVATEFEVELLKRPEPTYMLVFYDIDLVEKDPNLVQTLYDTMTTEPPNVSCGIAFANHFIPGGNHGIAMKCIDWDDFDGKNVLAILPDGYAMTRKVPYSAFMSWNKDSYGMGWTPGWHMEPQPQFKAAGAVEKWRQAILSMADPKNPCKACWSELLVNKMMKFNLVDMMCGSEVEDQDKCSEFVFDTQKSIVEDRQIFYKQNLPSCRSSPTRVNELFEFQGLFPIAKEVKRLWDRKNKHEFWLGIGDEALEEQCDGQGENGTCSDNTCEATHVVPMGDTCIANNINPESLVQAIKDDVIERCPEFFNYSSTGEQTTECAKYAEEHAKPFPIIYEE